MLVADGGLAYRKSNICLEKASISTHLTSMSRNFSDHTSIMTPTSASARASLTSLLEITVGLGQTFCQYSLPTDRGGEVLEPKAPPAVGPMFTHTRKF